MLDAQLFTCQAVLDTSAACVLYPSGLKKCSAAPINGVSLLSLCVMFEIDEWRFIFLGFFGLTIRAQRRKTDITYMIPVATWKPKGKNRYILDMNTSEKYRWQQQQPKQIHLLIYLCSTTIGSPFIAIGYQVPGIFCWA